MEAAFGPKDPGTPTWDIQPVVADALTQNPTTAAAPPRYRLVTPGDVTPDGLVAALGKDFEQLTTHGGWQAAQEAGYNFGASTRIPWQKFTVTGDPQTAVDAVRATLREGLETQYNVLKGGAVQSDRLVQTMVKNRVSAFGDDPVALMGLLAQRGKSAKGMAADVLALDYIAQSTAKEAAMIANHINIGYLDTYGSEEAARQALMDVVRVHATAAANSEAIVTNAARTMRAQRGDVSQPLLQALEQADSLDTKALANLIAQADGTPRGLERALTAGGNTAMDWVQYLYVNNLLWNPRTHFVNMVTNAYMLGVRPLERTIGGGMQWLAGNERGARIVKENLRQYTYMGNTLREAFSNAAEAFRLNDGILSAHASDYNQVGSSVGQEVAEASFKSGYSPEVLVYNAGLGAAKALGLPTRALGSVDELMKQTIYRSKVMAEAHVEGVTRGLEGDALSNFVRNTLEDAFDSQGRALNARALEEARISTFQQELNPGTLGAAAQAATNAWKPARLILPFVRTPTNVLRQGVKLTPGLNLIQTEYRNAIAGRLGAEAQAQALGQMTVGTAFMSYAGFLAASGQITGGGPSDPVAKKQMMDTGWRPYSKVSVGPNGEKVYTPFSYYDPVGLVFGMIADVVDITSRDPEGDTLFTRGADAALAVAMGLMKNMTNKTYLVSLTKALEGVTDVENKGERALQNLAQGFVPMSSALRFTNQTMVDPSMREARSVVDAIMAATPGLSDKLPKQYDVWGDPVMATPGLWVTGKNSIVDLEMRRMADEEGARLGPPAPSIGGADLRDVTLTDGRNAYEVYQQLAGRPLKGPPLKDTVAKIMATKAYQRAPDGDAGTRGTKLYIVAVAVSKYRDAALKRLKADKNVQTALGKKDAEVRQKYMQQRGEEARAQREAERQEQQLQNLLTATGAGR